MKKQGVGKAIFSAVGYVFLFLACQFAAGFVAEAVIMFSFAFSGMPMEEMMEAVTPAYNGMLYEITLISGLIILGAVAIMHRGALSQRAAIRKAPGSSVPAGLLLGFASYLGALLLMQVSLAIPAVKESQEGYMQQHEAISNAGGSLWAEMLYACIFAPLVVEILCRGLILGKLKQAMKPAFAIVLSGVLFGLIHGNLYQMVFTVPLGILLGWIAYRFDSILPTVLAHFGFNACNYLVRLGEYFDFPAGGDWETFFVLVTYLLCLFSIPMGILLLRSALGKTPRPAPENVTPETVLTQADVIPTTQSEKEGETMAAPEMIIVGLGNPGEKYAMNRHNCGFMALDYIALRQGTEFKNLRFRALTAETVIEGKKVLLLKPQTFMNSSGEAVREAAAFYKIPAEKVLVIFDDISFQPGVFRIRQSGSAGGHNGIKSIISCLGSDAFPRVKMGVGTPPPGWELMNWVLGNPPKEDLDHIIASLEDVYGTAKAFAREELERAAASFNGKQH